MLSKELIIVKSEMLNRTGYFPMTLNRSMSKGSVFFSGYSILLMLPEDIYFFTPVYMLITFTSDFVLSALIATFPADTQTNMQENSDFLVRMPRAFGLKG